MDLELKIIIIALFYLIIMAILVQEDISLVTKTFFLLLIITFIFGIDKYQIINPLDGKEESMYVFVFEDLKSSEVVEEEKLSSESFETSVHCTYPGVGLVCGPRAFINGFAIGGCSATYTNLSGRQSALVKTLYKKTRTKYLLSNNKFYSPFKEDRSLVVQKTLSNCKGL